MTPGLTLAPKACGVVILKNKQLKQKQKHNNLESLESYRRHSNSRKSPAEVIKGYGIKCYFKYNLKYILFSRH